MSINFKGINSGGFAGYELTDEILINFKFWIDWGLLNNGAFNTFDLNSSSFYSESDNKLFPVFDERFGNGRVWNGAGPSWVWESGLDIARVSGVYIDGNFYPTDHVGPYRFHTDYQRGRIIFDNPLYADSDVRVEYTSRAVDVAFADHPNFRKLIQNSLIDHVTNNMPSGVSPRENQIHLPAIFIDERSGLQRGLQLGGGQIKTRQIIFHIFADNASDRNLLMNFLDKQTRASFVMADINKFNFPFDAFGDIVPGISNWQKMTEDFPGKKVRIMDGTMQKIDSINPNLFRGRVSYNVEIDIGGI